MSEPKVMHEWSCYRIAQEGKGRPHAQYTCGNGQDDWHEAGITTGIAAEMARLAARVRWNAYKTGLLEGALLGVQLLVKGGLTIQEGAVLSTRIERILERVGNVASPMELEDTDD